MTDVVCKRYSEYVAKHRKNPLCGALTGCNCVAVQQYLEKAQAIGSMHWFTADFGLRSTGADRDFIQPSGTYHPKMMIAVVEEQCVFIGGQSDEGKAEYRLKKVGGQLPGKIFKVPQYSSKKYSHGKAPLDPGKFDKSEPKQPSPANDSFYLLHAAMQFSVSTNLLPVNVSLIASFMGGAQVALSSALESLAKTESSP